MSHPQATYLSTHAKPRAVAVILMEKVHFTDPCIQMLPLKSNPKLDLYIINLPHTISHHPANIIHNIILKPLKRPHHLIIIKSTCFSSPSELIFNIWTNISFKASWPCQIPLITEKPYMGRDYCEVIHPNSHNPWMPHQW